MLNVCNNYHTEFHYHYETMNSKDSSIEVTESWEMQHAINNWGYFYSRKPNDQSVVG